MWYPVDYSGGRRTHCSGSIGPQSAPGTEQNSDYRYFIPRGVACSSWRSVDPDPKRQIARFVREKMFSETTHCKKWKVVPKLNTDCKRWRIKWSGTTICRISDLENKFAKSCGTIICNNWTFSSINNLQKVSGTKICNKKRHSVRQFAKRFSGATIRKKRSRTTIVVSQDQQWFQWTKSQN